MKDICDHCAGLPYTTKIYKDTAKSGRFIKDTCSPCAAILISGSGWLVWGNKNNKIASQQTQPICPTPIQTNSIIPHFDMGTCFLCKGKNVKNIVLNPTYTIKYDSCDSCLSNFISLGYTRIGSIQQNIIQPTCVSCGLPSSGKMIMDLSKINNAGTVPVCDPCHVILLKTGIWADATPAGQTPPQPHYATPTIQKFSSGNGVQVVPTSQGNITISLPKPGKYYYIIVSGGGGGAGGVFKECECGNKKNPMGQGHSSWCQMYKKEFE